MCTFNIGIAGAGLGGLAAAVALSRLGHSVTVYEATSQLRQIGSGIQLTPNASKHLLKWGVNEFLPELDCDSSSFQVRRWQNGHTIGTLATEKFYERFNGPYIQVFRADLQSALLRIAERNGTQVFTGCPVIGYDFEKPEIILQDGRRIKKDLVIGADGTKSTSRKQLRGIEELRTISTGLAVYRATVAANNTQDDPDLSSFIKTPGLVLWIGPKQHAVVYSMKGGSLVNIVLEYQDTTCPSTWDESSFVKHIRLLFQEWDPCLRKLLEKVEPASKWPLSFSAPLQHWSSKSGKFVLIGDASHVIPSFLAQGAAMAIEDAVMLSTKLSEARSEHDLSRLIKSFENIRKTRKEQVQVLSLRNVELYHLEDGSKQRERDGILADNPELRPIWNDAEGQKFLYGYEII